MNSVPRTFSKVRGMWGVFAGRGVKPVSLGLILEKQARKSPNKPLILFEDRIITYRQFNEEANRYADLFISRGFKKGDTVALVMNNRPEYLIVHAGLAKIGVIPALINNNLKAHVLAHAINISAARAVILGHEMLDSYQEATTEIELQQPKTIFIEKETRDLTTPEGMEDLAPLLRKASPQDPVQTATINSADTLEYIYTSGTTGLPKATMVHHGRWIQLAYALGGNSLNMISDDIMYCCLPLYHNSGINIAWATTLFHGATIVIRRKFSTSNFWTDVRRYRANMFIYIGELCRYLNNQPVQPDDGDNPLQYILGNGMRAEYWTEFQQRFGIKRIVEVYGATEGVGGMYNNRGTPGMMGKLTILGIKMSEVARYDLSNDDYIRNAAGWVEKCQVGERGMLLAKITKRSPFIGYKGNTQATQAKLIENIFESGDMYFVSGDLVQLHKQGYVSFVDRLGDTYRWKGENVSTNEVADTLNRFGSIEDSNVYGVLVPNTEGRAGMVALTLLPEAELDLKSFASYVTRVLPIYARPYFLRLRPEPDATTSFKQIKSALQNEGFDPGKISDPLYFLHPETQEYVPLTSEVYNQITGGSLRF